MRYLCELAPGLGVNPGAGQNGALCIAAEDGRTGVVQYLCALPAERGVEPGARKNYPLRWAALRGHVAVVQFLCELPPERGVDPAAGDHAAIRLAVRSEHAAVVQYLCERPRRRKEGKQVNAALSTELVRAITAPARNQIAARLRIVRTAAYIMVERWRAGPKRHSHPVATEVVQAALKVKAWDVVRFLAFELPGGAKWHLLIEWHTAKADADDAAGVALHRELTAVLSKPVWKTGASLFILRLLRDGCRARATSERGHDQFRRWRAATHARDGTHSVRKRRRKRRRKRHKRGRTAAGASLGD